MTGRPGEGASVGRDAVLLALRELVTAATVRIHRTRPGHSPQEPGDFLGSGFFVAPNWVLTCAHVIDGGAGGEVAVICRPGGREEPYAVPGEVAATLPEHVDGPGQGAWPAPDLALVRLREPVDHECLYLSERPAPHYSEGRVFYAGWTLFRGRPQPQDGFLAVPGGVGGWSGGVQLRLGEHGLPPGLSGGPVIDPVRGEVVGVLSSRVDHGAGAMWIGIERLRTLPVPPSARPPDPYRQDPYRQDPYRQDSHWQDSHWQDSHWQDSHWQDSHWQDPYRQDPYRQDPYQSDLYQVVCHAHDRYHRDRRQPSDSGRPTWTDLQTELGARPGRALSPDERVELLGRLADLPPPESTRGLLDILASLTDFRPSAMSPAPRGWRDGLGALYENARFDGVLPLVVDYAMRVMTAERPATPFVLDAEQALWEWIKQVSTRLGSGPRSDLAHRRAQHLGGRLHERSVGGGARFLTGDTAREPLARSHRHSVLLEVERRAWQPDQCDWSVAVMRPDGDVTRLDEGQGAGLDGLPGGLAGPLAEAFRHCDEPGQPAALYAALPHRMLDLPVDEWRLRPDGRPLGVERPVLVRCSDRDQLPGEDSWYGDELSGDDLEAERRDRWRRVHVAVVRTRAEVLDCDDSVRRPVPGVSELRGLPPGVIPVLCREGDRRYEDDDTALGRIVRAGFGVVLWRRGGRHTGSVCGEFHRGARLIVDEAAGAGELPAVVHGLRNGLREGRTESFWAHGIALLYDDPQQPLPGTDDLLEAP
ncbi:trypsin-like peptidase domain-containing protein [Streptomyces humi]|uniref:VMAP-C domain-containing protein n=1 Tax=Streptomyces humi TaxID=1428620 RepID=UPI00062884A2|nr:trypsin-like peptidase domain-containing protein [Streptomyces humi]